MTNTEAVEILTDVVESGNTGLCESGELFDALRAILESNRRGRWIKHSGWNDDTHSTEYSCSECNEWEDKQSNYCPNCGAVMEEATNG